MMRRVRAVGIGALILGAAAIVVLPVEAGALVVLSASVIVVAASALSAYRLKRSPLDAPGLYGGLSAITFGLLSVGWLGTPPMPGPGLTPDEVTSALLLVAAGLVVFAAGAHLAARGTARLEPLVPALPGRGALTAAFGLGVLAASGSLALGTYGYLADPSSTRALAAVNEVVALVQSLGPLVVLATAVAFFASGERRLRGPMIAFLAAQVFLGLVSGFKGQALQPLVLVLVAYVLFRRRVPWVPVVAVAAITFLMLIPAIDTYRLTTREPTNISAAGKAFREAVLVRPDRLVLRSYEYISLRFRYVDHVALIVDRTPTVYPWGDGSRYELLPLLVAVPRAVWPEKPVLDEGGEFSHTYWEIPLSARTATPMTQVGDLYRNFGAAGIVAGLAAWGVLLGLLTRIHGRSQSLRFDMVYLYLLVTAVVYIEADLPQLVARVVKALPLVIATAWLLLPGPLGPPGYQVAGRRLRHVLGRRLATSESPSEVRPPPCAESTARTL